MNIVAAVERPVTIGRLRRDLALQLQYAFGAGDKTRTPALDARLIVAHVLSIAPPSDLPLHDDRVLSSDEMTAAKALARRRARGEPVARLTGWREFWGIPFALSQTTLVPRPESETLVEVVLEFVASRRDDRLRLLDLGTGSGCILLALLSELPAAEGIGIDLDEAAIITARQNAWQLGLSARARFLVGDWADAITGRFDVIVSNPPYIPSVQIAGLAPEVRSFDPIAALDGGSDGLDSYRSILPDLARLLDIGGVACVEAGDGQAVDIVALAGRSGLTARTRSDLSGGTRAVLLRTIVGKSDVAKKSLGNRTRSV